MNAITQFWRDPAMPYVESRRACHSRACYKPHSHPTFSIGAVDQGVSLFTGASDGPVTLRAGTLVFIPATRLHACNPVPDTAWSYQMLHLDALWLHSVRQESPCAKNGCDHAESIRIVYKPQIYTRFCQLNSLLFSQADCSDKEAAIIEFIGDYDDVDGLRIDAPVAPQHHFRQLDPVLSFLQQKPGDTASLSELAAMVGMSRYQLIRAFRTTTGMTPHAWQLNLRINHAREQIRAGQDIAAVAFRLGFADQAHFQRVFKAHTGITPGRYRG